MKKALLFSVMITATCLANGRNSFQQYEIENGKSTFLDSSTSVVYIQDILMEIMNVTGLQPNFELKKSKVQNLEASISRRNRVILYNPEYISWINSNTKNKWGVTALLAHEIGHHLNGHTIRKNGSNPKVELEADEFAGFVLQKMGATLEQAQDVMNYIANAQTSSTHPARALRMKAIASGWKRASGS
jgi:hypothetical protein